MARMPFSRQLDSLLAWLFRRRAPALVSRHATHAHPALPICRQGAADQRIVQDRQGRFVVPLPLRDRLVARLMGGALLNTLAGKAGWRAGRMHSLAQAELARIGRGLSGIRALRLFSVDARTNRSRLLAQLLAECPVEAEQMLRSLTPDERVHVLSLFGFEAPVLTPEAAGNAAIVLVRVCERRHQAKVLLRLLACSGRRSRAAALSYLYDSQDLDFGLLFAMHQLSPPGKGCDLVASCLVQMRSCIDGRLGDYLETFQALVDQALPCYLAYWSRCTGLAPAACPVGGTRFADWLACLTPEVLQGLCHQGGSGFRTGAARLGWRKVQPRSSATLRHPAAAMGDFLFRTLSARTQQRHEALACA